MLFRRQKSLALNTTDEIPGDNEFENHCGLKVVSTYTVCSLEEIFHREERKTNLEVTDSYGYVCRAKRHGTFVLLPLEAVSHGGRSRVTRNKFLKTRGNAELNNIKRYNHSDK